MRMCVFPCTAKYQVHFNASSTAVDIYPSALFTQGSKGKVGVYLYNLLDYTVIIFTRVP